MPFLKIDDQELYYRWEPVNNGPILLFIHGLGSSSSFYDPIIPTLHGNGFSCLAFDTPGSALSKYRGRDSDVDAICGAISALIAALELDTKRIIVIGHSMGCIIASELAAHMGLLGVVLLGPVQPSNSVTEVFVTRVKTVEDGGMEAIANAVPAAATGPKSTPTQRAFIRALILAQSSEGYISLCKTIMYAKPPLHSEIHCPLLLIAGSHDKTAPLQAATRIFSNWGNENTPKELKVLEGVGHWHVIEAPEEVCELVNAFASHLRS